MSQASHHGFQYAGKRKQTRRERPLVEMDQVGPWTGLLGLFRLAADARQVNRSILGFAYGMQASRESMMSTDNNQTSFPLLRWLGQSSKLRSAQGKSKQLGQP